MPAPSRRRRELELELLRRLRAAVEEGQHLDPAPPLVLPSSCSAPRATGTGEGEREPAGLDAGGCALELVGGSARERPPDPPPPPPLQRTVDPSTPPEPAEGGGGLGGAPVEKELWGRRGRERNGEKRDVGGRKGGRGD
jgi:hypothetical protein